jgi:glycosyltransferase involved in cell wall biosynthesis
MRICAISSFPPTRAGIADYGAHLAEHLARDPRVESVTVLADRGPGALPHEPAGRLDVRRVWRRDGAGTCRALLRAVQSVRPDVVWFNLGLTMFGTRLAAAAGGLVAPLCTSMMGYRTVVTLHELPALTNLPALGLRPGAHRFGLSLVPKMVLRADLVVVTLGHYRRYLMERHGASNVRHIAHGSYDAPQWADEPERETVLVLGTFGPHKDPGVVAEAVARLRRRGQAVQFVVAGADHPRYPGFMAECRLRYGLNGSWIGYVPSEQLSALFARATVVVVPPRASTGSSGVIYRAMSHGRAVLASDLRDYRGLARDENLELAWFEPGNPAALADALEALLHDRKRRQQIVAHNLRAMRRLGPAQTVDAYLAGFADGDATTVPRPVVKPRDLVHAREPGGEP